MGTSLKKLYGSKYFWDIGLLAISFVAIVVCGIVFEQQFVKLLPVLVSLFILILSAYANRWAYFIGAVNAGIYCIGFYYEGLYGSVAQSAYAVAIQFVIFFKWKKNSYKKATIFKKLSNLGLVIVTAATVVFFVLAYWAFSSLNANYVALDSALFVLGIVIPILTLMAYIQTPIFAILSGVLSVWMWSVNAAANISNITYLLFNIYSLYRVCQMGIRWRSLYKEQQLLKNLLPPQQDTDGASSAAA